MDLLLKPDELESFALLPMSLLAATAGAPTQVTVGPESAAPWNQHRYGRPMNSPVPHVDGQRPAASAGDLRQADYYVGLLEERRAELRHELTRDHVNLAKHREAGDLLRATRDRREIRLKERESDVLARLLDALEARFSGSPADG
jgi:hypothetical protein